MFHLLVHRGHDFSLTCGTVSPGLSVSDSNEDKAPAEPLNKSIEGNPLTFCCFGSVLAFEIRVLESWWP